MKTIKKIEYKKFVPLSLGATGLAIALSQSREEALVIFGIYILSIINLFMLSEGVMELLKTKDNPDNFKVIMLLVGKMALLILGITLGVQIMESRIIIPVLNYVIQIFIFILSYRRT